MGEGRGFGKGSAASSEAATAHSASAKRKCLSSVSTVKRSQSFIA